MRTFLLTVLLAIAAVPATASASGFDNLDAKTTKYLVSQGILEGSLDGSIYLATDITRAEFVQAITEYVYPNWAMSEQCLEELDPDIWPGVSYSLLFRDVPKDAPYALHLCAAMRGGMVWGYGDGNFRPDSTINLAEASKIISVAFDLGYKMPEYQTNDWYSNYLTTVRRYTEFPNTVTSASHTMTVGETRTMLQNISARAASLHGSRVNGKVNATPVSTSSVQVR